MNIVIIY